MPRPPGIVMTFDEFHNTLPPKVGRPLKTDPKPENLLRFANVGGVLLDPGARGCPPIRSAFPDGEAGDAEFAAHLDRLGERLRAGARNKPVRDCGERPAQLKRLQARLYRHGAHMSWLDLRTLRCAGCGRALLGPSESAALASGELRGSAAGLAWLPPPVAGRVADRPVCAACLPARVA